MLYGEFMKLNLIRTDYIVIIRLRYEHDKEYDNITEILEYDPTSDIHFWVSDWYEGQQHVEILAAVPLSHITIDRIGHVIIV